MSPEALAAKNTESGHQKALFAWANMARLFGFAVADRMDNYGMPMSLRAPSNETVPLLEWLHAIPNGGFRDPITAARMKAEGVKPGIADVFLPAPVRTSPGLYIELKRLETGKPSAEQNEFAAYCKRVGYEHVFAYGWRHAADAIKFYLS